MNLLDHFILHHLQVSVLKSELLRTTREAGVRDARVELNLAPRLLETDEKHALPSYQVSAKLVCKSGRDDEDGPAFNATVALEAVYRQISGDPIDVSEFTGQHSSLARQLYPLLQQEMRGLLSRMGLSRIELPFDLAPRRPEVKGTSIEVSPSLH